MATEIEILRVLKILGDIYPSESKIQLLSFCILIFFSEIRVNVMTGYMVMDSVMHLVQHSMMFFHNSVIHLPGRVIVRKSTF